METRIPLSLKVETSDELYYALIEPLRVNRNLTSFIMSLFDAYLHDDRVHDLVDAFMSRNSSVEKINSHIQRIAELQGKNMRLIEDYDSSIEGALNKSNGTNGGTETTGITDINKADIMERISNLEVTVSKLVSDSILRSVDNENSASGEKSGTVESISQNDKSKIGGLNGSTAVKNENNEIIGGSDKNAVQGGLGGVMAVEENSVAVYENSVVGGSEGGKTEEDDATSEAENLLGGFMDSLF